MGTYEGRPALILQRFAGAHDDVGRAAFTARTASDARRATLAEVAISAVEERRLGRPATP